MKAYRCLILVYFNILLHQIFSQLKAMLSSSPSRSFTDFCHQKGFLHLVTFFYGVIETKSFLCFILACTTVPNLQIKYLVLVIPMEYCGVIFFLRVGGGGIVFFFWGWGAVSKEGGGE